MFDDWKTLKNKPKNTFVTQSQLNQRFIFITGLWKIIFGGTQKMYLNICANV